MGIATDKFNEAIGNRTRDHWVNTKDVVAGILKETPKEKRILVAHELLRAGEERSKCKGDGSIMLTVIPAIAQTYPDDKAIIDLCVQAAERRQDDGMRAAILLIQNPKNKDAAREIVSAMCDISRDDPDNDAVFRIKDARLWKFLHTSEGRDMVQDAMSEHPNDPVMANLACQMMHNFQDIAETVRADWTAKIVEANPENKRVVEMAFAQESKVSWWRGSLQILSSIARANPNDGETLSKIRDKAERFKSGYSGVENEYKGKLLALTCPPDKEASRLISMANNATNDGKIDILTAVAKANPNNTDIAKQILYGNYPGEGLAGGSNTGYTVSTIFSAVLKANPNNEEIKKLAVDRAKVIMEDPELQGKSFIVEAIDGWTGKDKTIPSNTNAGESR